MERNKDSPERFESLSDIEIVREVLKDAPSALDVLMRRHNHRLYRVGRSVLRNHAEAEDVVQDTWVKAYSHLGQFTGAASFSTWVSKIAAHEAFARLRRQSRFAQLPESERLMTALWATSRRIDPEHRAAGGELHAALEAAIDSLPVEYRSVFTLQSIERMSTEETAECLSLTEAVVKVRLQRARVMLRRILGKSLGTVPPDLYRFYAPRCNRVSDTVHWRLGMRKKVPA